MSSIALAPAGEMSGRVRSFDWSRTQLGSMDQWPQSLRTAVGTVLSAPVPMALWWGPGLTMVYNDAYARLLGGKHPEALGRSSREVWSEAWPKIGPLSEAVFRGGDSVSRERDHFVLERNGTPEDAWFTWSYSPVTDESGGVGGLLNLAREDTPQVLAERAARDAELRFAAVFEAARDALIVYAPNGTIVEVNAAACRMYGYRREEMVGVNAPEAVHPEARAHFDEFMRVAGGGGEFRCQTIDRRRDGTEFPIEVVGTSFSYGGKPHLMAVVRDISERRRAEEARRMSEFRFRRLVEQSPLSTQVFAPDGSVRQVNRAWERLWGVTLADIPGYNILQDQQLIERGIMPAIRKAFAGEADAAEPIPYVPDRGVYAGQVRWCGAYIYPVKNDAGRVEEVVLVHHDVTDQRRAAEERERLLAGEQAARAEAERASRAKDEFLATLSHELRTPLTPVLLTVSLLENHPALADDLRQDVATIRRNVELESRLISDLLDLTRIEKGKLQLDVQDVDVHLVVRSAIDICQREASAKLRVDLQARSHVVRGDSTRLQQVFWNLINNAMKFTGDQGTITVQSADVGNGSIRIEVIDTGVGIDPALLPRLFTAFEQGEIRAVRQQAGLGLGLSISKRLVEMHGGRVAASSAGRGRGATFTVELPTVDSFVVPIMAQSPRTPSTVAPLRVLLVEDHETTLNVLTRLLRGLGHEVTGVTSAASAVSAAGQDRFDLVVCDLGLPDGSGLDVMKAVRGKYEGRAIALTGYGMESDIAASRAAGFTEHLIKPVDLATLDRAIRRVTAAEPQRTA